MKPNTLFPHFMYVFSYLSHVDVWIREYGMCHHIFIPQLKQEVMDYCLKVSTNLNFKKLNINGKNASVILFIRISRCYEANMNKTKQDNLT